MKTLVTLRYLPIQYSPEKCGTVVLDSSGIDNSWNCFIVLGKVNLMCIL
jgi:hypothetical protein